MSEDLTAWGTVPTPHQQRRMNANKNARAHNVAVLERGLQRTLGSSDGLIEPTAWDGKPIPARSWIVPGLIPANTVTMITGNGGDGKSLLALQLAVAAATRTRWLGRDVKGSRVMGLWAEDDHDELMRRTDGVLAPLGLAFSDLENLTFFDRDGRESLLYEAQHNDTTGQTSPFFQQLMNTVAEMGVELLILDSLYNFFGGNENIRSQANQFIGELKRFARKLGCAVVIVAHPSRAGMGKDGDGTAGNTAWHNAVRSRLYLHRKKHPSGDPDKKGPLVLEHMKANYGRVEDQIEIAWENGRFVPTDVVSQASEKPRTEAEIREQMDLLGDDR